MQESIYIRPLVIGDALTSYKWRNNEKLWRFTGSRPDRLITPEIETEWLDNVLKRTNEKRFAMCLSDSGQYIGNVFLTDIENGQGIIHTFIGETEFWGGGRAVEGVQLVLRYAFEELHLTSVIADINKKNLASQSVAKASGFVDHGDFIGDNQTEFKKMIYTIEMYQESKKLSPSSEKPSL